MGSAVAARRLHAIVVNMITQSRVESRRIAQHESESVTRGDVFGEPDRIDRAAEDSARRYAPRVPFGDQALGGGISGGTVRVGGAMACCSRTASTAGAGASNVTMADVMTDGAHGAIGWHPAGAHGRWHGVSWDGLGAGCSDAGISIPGISAPVAAPTSACTMAGITHANPLPARIIWKKRPAEANAAKGLKRLIVAMFPIKILGYRTMFQARRRGADSPSE